MWKQRVQAAAVTLFVLAIAAVVVVLLTRVDHEAAPSNRPSAGASGDIDSAGADPVGPASITAGKGDLIARVVAGSCAAAGGPKLELSDDLATSFHRIRVPQIDDGTGISALSPTVRAIVFVEASSQITMSVGAADSECKIHRYSTTDGGGTWKQEPGPLTEWYIDPKSGWVVSPTAPTDAGCTRGVAQLAPVSKKIAKVFCAGAAIRSTSDGGQTWTTVGKLRDVSAVVFTGAQIGYALVADSDCKSRIYSTGNGGLTWTPRGCIIKAYAVPWLTDTAKGLVAAGPGGARLSTDDGDTWKFPPKE